MSFEIRLQALPRALSDPKLLRGRGLGNEINYYIFDYPPQRQPDMDQAIKKLVPALQAEGINIVEIGLYRTMLSILESEGYLQPALELEEQEGPAELRQALKSLITPELMAEAVARQSEGADLVILTEVGTVYPLLRSHSILNNLHERLDSLPVVMFFPGTYDGRELQLFCRLKDDNYYRAFRLVPDDAATPT